MVTWGASTTLGDQTAINDTVEEFLNTIDMSTALICDMTIEIDNESGSVTNGVIISVYTRVDTTNFSDDPLIRFEHIPSGIALERIPLQIAGVYEFRLGFLASAATDDYTVGGDYRLRTA
jgi:hypothetical protein